MKPRLLITEASGFSATALARLREVADVVPADLDRAGLLAGVGEADALWVRLRHRIDAEVLAAAPRLTLLASPTTGLDHLDLETARSRGIRVLSLRGETELLRDVRATAELTIGLILSLLRRIPAAVTSVGAGRWDRDAFKGREIRGKTVGIVGYGRLGKLVAGYLRAFGAVLIACDPAGVDDPDIARVGLTELLRRAEIVTLHVNLTEETRGLIGAAEIGAMRHDAVLINTSRGDLVDETALLSALAGGRIAGAALDVLAGEQSSGMAHHPLVAYARDHGELLITPHIGGCTHESMEQTEVVLAERVCAALSAK